MRQLSIAGAKALEAREGKRNKAYRDTKGIATIGIGHTGDDFDMSSVWSDEQVLKAFMHDVQWAVDAVNTVEKPLNQNMFDALVSFVFNVGSGAFHKSSMKRFLNLGLLADAAREFDRWVIPAEITARRMSEKQQFLKPV